MLDFNSDDFNHTVTWFAVVTDTQCGQCRSLRHCQTPLVKWTLTTVSVMLIQRPSLVIQTLWRSTDLTNMTRTAGTTDTVMAYRTNEHDKDRRHNGHDGDSPAMWMLQGWRNHMNMPRSAGNTDTTVPMKLTKRQRFRGQDRPWHASCLIGHHQAHGTNGIHPRQWIKVHPRTVWEVHKQVRYLSSPLSQTDAHGRGIIFEV